MKPTIPENSCLIIQLSYFFRYAVERVNSVRHILPRLVLCTLGACTEFWECHAMCLENCANSALFFGQGITSYSYYWFRISDRAEVGTTFKRLWLWCSLGWELNPSPTDHECMHFLYFRQSDLYEQFPPMPSLYYIYNNKERKHSIQRFKIFHNPKFWTWSILTHHIFFYVFSRVWLFSISSSCRGL